MSKAALRSNRTRSKIYSRCPLRGQGRCGQKAQLLILWNGKACMQTDRQAASCVTVSSESLCNNTLDEFRYLGQVGYDLV